MLVGFLAAPAVGQGADWTVLLSPQLSRKLDQDGGPSLGGLGAALQVYRHTPESSWAWGGAAALHRLGTFESPNVADRGERALTLGLRGLRGSLWSGWYTNIGVDLLAVQEAPESVRWSTDPGVAGYLGAGWIRRTGRTKAGFFVEAGLTGALATGENTIGGGVYLSLRAGLAL